MSRTLIIWSFRLAGLAIVGSFTLWLLIAAVGCTSTPSPAPDSDPSRYRKPVPAHYPTP
jgi:hypothetical protein